VVLQIPSGEGVVSIPFPLNPSIQVDGLVPETVRMFRSAVYPCVVEFTIYNDPVTTVDEGYARY
jgi:hypothetical protein